MTGRLFASVTVIATVIGALVAAREYFDARTARHQDRSFMLATAFSQSAGAEATRVIADLQRAFIQHAEQQGGTVDFAAYLNAAYDGDNPAVAPSAHYIYDFFSFLESCIKASHCDEQTLSTLMCRRAEDLNRTLCGLTKAKVCMDSSFGDGLDGFATRCVANRNATLSPPRPAAPHSAPACRSPD